MHEFIDSRIAQILEEAKQAEAEMQKYFEEGYAAFQQGKGIDSNPYCNATAASRTWADGHAEAFIDSCHE